jgi:hypothetical protein
MVPQDSIDALKKAFRVALEIVIDHREIQTNFEWLAKDIDIIEAHTVIPCPYTRTELKRMVKTRIYALSGQLRVLSSRCDYFWLMADDWFFSRGDRELPTFLDTFSGYSALQIILALLKVVLDRDLSAIPKPRELWMPTYALIDGELLLDLLSKEVEIINSETDKGKRLRQAEWYRLRDRLKEFCKRPKPIKGPIEVREMSVAEASYQGAAWQKQLKKISKMAKRREAKRLAEIQSYAEAVKSWTSRKPTELVGQVQTRKEIQEQGDQKPSADERACAVLFAHQDWTKTQIAEAAGIKRPTLYKLLRFQEAWNFLNEQSKRERKMTRGTKDPETGRMEAWNSE